jgi:hypothetical protein
VTHHDTQRPAIVILHLIGDGDFSFLRDRLSAITQSSIGGERAKRFHINLQSPFLVFSHSADVSLQKQEVRVWPVDIVRVERREADGSVLGRHDLELLRGSSHDRCARRGNFPSWIDKQCE